MKLTSTIFVSAALHSTYSVPFLPIIACQKSWRSTSQGCAVPESTSVFSIISKEATLKIRPSTVDDRADHPYAKRTEIAERWNIEQPVFTVMWLAVDASVPLSAGLLAVSVMMWVFWEHLLFVDFPAFMSSLSSTCPGRDNSWVQLSCSFLATSSWKFADSWYLRLFRRCNGAAKATTSALTGLVELLQLLLIFYETSALDNQVFLGLWTGALCGLHGLMVYGIRPFERNWTRLADWV